MGQPVPVPSGHDRPLKYVTSWELPDGPVEDLTVDDPPGGEPPEIDLPAAERDPTAVASKPERTADANGFTVPWAIVKDPDAE